MSEQDNGGSLSLDDSLRALFSAVLSHSLSNNAVIRAMVAAIARDEITKVARSTADDTRPGVDRPHPTPPPVSEGADSDRHPWVFADYMTLLIPQTFGTVTMRDPIIAAELNRLHRAERDATRKERERCVRWLVAYLESAEINLDELHEALSRGKDAP